MNLANAPTGTAEDYLQRAKQRFTAKVAVAPNGCWHWTAAVQSSGYGVFSWGGRGRTVLAHRWAYATYVASIPAGLEVDHRCHNPDATCPGGKCLYRRCVRPSHLEPVTGMENGRRAWQQRQAAPGGPAPP